MTGKDMQELQDKILTPYSCAAPLFIDGVCQVSMRLLCDIDQSYSALVSAAKHPPEFMVNRPYFAKWLAVRAMVYYEEGSKLAAEYYICALSALADWGATQ